MIKDLSVFTTFVCKCNADSITSSAACLVLSDSGFTFMCYIVRFGSDLYVLFTKCGVAVKPYVH